jgi:phosphoadenosine phosphosulfate reductase
VNTEQIEKDIQNLSIPQTLAYFAGLYPGQVSFSSSLGQEDQVITDIIARNNVPVSIFTIDTGRLFAEAYDLIQITEARYNKKLEVYFPEVINVEALVKDHGINCFYESVDLRKKCCQVRKVMPLRRALKDVKVWVTGLRASQSENRHDMKAVQWDSTYNVIKYNPLLNWELEDVLKYIKEYTVPYNPLHDKGFVSIGCASCTRAILPGEDIRAGRWWWEGDKKECGLHEPVVNFQI